MFHRTSTESATKADTDGNNTRSNTDEPRIGPMKNRILSSRGSVMTDTSGTTIVSASSNNITDIPNERHWPMPSKSRGQSSLSGSKVQQHQHLNNQHQLATASASASHPNNMTSHNHREDVAKSQQNSSLSNRARSHISSSQMIRTNSSATNNQNPEEGHFDGSALHQDHNRLGQHQHSTSTFNNQHYRPLGHLKHSQYHQNLHHNITMSLATQLASNAATTTEVAPNTFERIPTASTTSPTSSSSTIRPINDKGVSTNNHNSNSNINSNSSQRLQQQPQPRNKTYTITSKTFAIPNETTTSDTNRQQQQQQYDIEQGEQPDTDEAIAAIKQELAELGSPGGLDQTDLEALGSLESNLPIELSFLIKQQAVCMARINYLTRQVKELKETKQQNHGNNSYQQAQHQSHKSQQPVATNCIAPISVNAASNGAHQHHHPHSHHHQEFAHQQQPHHHQAASQSERYSQYPSRLNLQHQQTAAPHNTLQPIHLKNGNLILSDDSGGEYSRATISDDDELSSLLDQIAKTVRSERNPSNQSAIINSSASGNCTSGIGLMPSHQSTIQPLTTTALGAAFGGVINHQQYAIINPGQFHQQAVPIFVMGQPVAMHTHPSSINSNVLPGVHFQPEPRYNQYYEEMYAPMHQRSSTTGTLRPLSHQSHHSSNQPRPHQQFDSSISAIDQLVSHREKRQIKSQLKSTDNWLKMRSSTLCNSVENQSSTSNIVQNGLIANASDSAHEILKDNLTEQTQQNISATAASSSSSSSTTPMNKDNLGSQ